MIIFNIILRDEIKAGEISLYLIENGYALQTHVDTNIIITPHGEKRTIRVFFITKGLLYTVIEEEIHKYFFSADMVLYATPVSHVNREFADVIRTNIKPV